MNTEKQIDKSSTGIITIDQPSQMMSLASTVRDFIKDKKLYTTIEKKGDKKQYVNVEGWQFLGGQLGIVAITSKLENISNEDEIKYWAEIDLQSYATGKIVGKGIAICSSKEKGKGYFDEYAIASMALTRATGKAYRLTFGWIIKAAGYEATPSEEMDFDHSQSNSNTVNKQAAKKTKPAAPPPAKEKKQELTDEQKLQIAIERVGKLLLHPASWDFYEQFDFQNYDLENYKAIHEALIAEVKVVNQKFGKIIATDDKEFLPTESQMKKLVKLWAQVDDATKGENYKYLAEKGVSKQYIADVIADLANEVEFNLVKHNNINSLKNDQRI